MSDLVADFYSLKTLQCPEFIIDGASANYKQDNNEIEIELRIKAVNDTLIKKLHNKKIGSFKTLGIEYDGESFCFKVRATGKKNVEALVKFLKLSANIQQWKKLDASK